MRDRQKPTPSPIDYKLSGLGSNGSAGAGSVCVVVSVLHTSSLSPASLEVGNEKYQGNGCHRFWKW